MCVCAHYNKYRELLQSGVKSSVHRGEFEPSSSELKPRKFLKFKKTQNLHVGVVQNFKVLADSYRHQLFFLDHPAKKRHTKKKKMPQNIDYAHAYFHFRKAFFFQSCNPTQKGCPIMPIGEYAYH